MKTIELIGQKAKRAGRILATSKGEEKNKALEAIASALRQNTSAILKANKLDLENGRAAGLTDALLDRLALDEDRVESMAKGVEEIAMADDPVGKVLWGSTRPNGLKIQKVSVPLGVVAVIYEARPNVSSDAAALCLKAGNAVVLRGGKEAINSNKAIVDILRQALKGAGLPIDCLQLVEDTSRESANALMKSDRYIDVLIPRGGAGLIKAVKENSTIPVIETGMGNCHTYIEKSADLDMALEIVLNAKTSRPSVCNACETLLLDRHIAKAALPPLYQALSAASVTLKGDESTKAILPEILQAGEDDWGREYLDLTLSVKIVKGIDEAIDHISQYGTGHSEAIITSNYGASEKFLNQVDAAAVYVNASTRFTDGGEFGFGAEIGISTQKLHARGPLGLADLTSQKYLIYGQGQIR
ncbi:MAG: glutamate-5-semialdehyde dehydrogenase [Clostridiales bacterium]|nr:glutamate-5-semialdehyde dehydrogenase [Clostridiales bacterium]